MSEKKRLRRVVIGAFAMAGIAGGMLGAAPTAAAAPVEPAAVLGGCDWTGCGVADNRTGRGFHVTLDWPSKWDAARWVGPHSKVGGSGVDVDGLYVGVGCRMSGVIEGGLYRFPFTWGTGWHKISNNETAFVFQHSC